MPRLTPVEVKPKKYGGRPVGATGSGGPIYTTYKNLTALEQQALKTQFLEALELLGSVKRAAGECGWSHHTFFRIKDEDPEFAAVWNNIWRRRINSLEDTLLDRAENGWEEPVFQMGTEVGRRIVHDNRLGVFFLQKQRPEQYGDKIEITMEPAKVANAVRAHLEDAEEAATRALELPAGTQKPAVVAESSAKSVPSKQSPRSKA